MGLSDLIQTKKTQRLKDWGAIEMLLAACVAEHRPALAAGLAGDVAGMKGAIMRELQDGIEADRAYQRSFTSELEAMRQ